MSDNTSVAFQREINSYIALKKKIKTYVDVSLAFKPSPITGDITLLTNEQAINNSIKNVIMFLPSEVPFLFDFGSTTSRYLFDIIDEVTAGVVSDEIKRAILFCEPRVTFAPLDEDDMDVASAYLNSTPRSIEDLMFQDDLGVTVEAQPEQNQLVTTVKYRIVGGEKIYRVQEILTPTR